MSERLDRRLVAVMFTDMVGYTALMQADERLGLDKRDRYMSALERHHDAFSGTIVQRLGDGSMSMFPSSLACGVSKLGLANELISRRNRVDTPQGVQNSVRAARNDDLQAEREF